MLPSKNHFSHWPFLKSLLEQGIFCYLDLYFAKKMLPSGPENQALLLAILFSLHLLSASLCAIILSSSVKFLYLQFF